MNATSSTTENKNLTNQSMLMRRHCELWQPRVNFGTLKDEMIRDRVVCGFTDNSIRRKLLQEPKMVLVKCLDICRSSEATSTHLKEICGQSPSSNTPVQNVNALVKRKKSKAPLKRLNKNQQESKKQPIPDSREMLKCCKHYGRSHIKQRIKCPAFGKVCNACNRQNHFAEMCKSAPGRNSR